MSLTKANLSLHWTTSIPRYPVIPSQVSTVKVGATLVMQMLKAPLAAYEVRYDWIPAEKGSVCWSEVEVFARSRT